ncbi:helix-turn-helix domain-containing protein [Enterococcus casseliflavus]|uniref:helix-turn-helix domain-containing protein n=1 Tax=Enterococcus casseliflavus TaxID=37734 RepID=UPI002953F7E7|nr:helix-turn-helix transcriptional regulator [Enterococcus casseliflavus]MDV7751195.1 helix-turn-helix transcriptional regulator [Enterococcus casseliflavus]
MSIESKLKRLREEKKWSKAETARRLGISGSAYSNYEYGNREPKKEFLKKIALLFEVPIGFLVDDDIEDAYEEARNELDQVRQTALDQQVDNEQAIKNLRYYFKNLEQFNKEDEFEDVTSKLEELTAFIADLSSEEKEFDELISVYQKKDPDFTGVIKQFYHF